MTIRYSLFGIRSSHSHGHHFHDIHAAHAVGGIDKPAVVNGHIVGGGALLALGARCVGDTVTFCGPVSIVPFWTSPIMVDLIGRAPETMTAENTVSITTILPPAAMAGSRRWHWMSPSVLWHKV